MKDHIGAIKPVRQTGDSTGGPTKPIEKDMDNPYANYHANETVPEHDYHEEASPDPFAENPGSFAKRFV